MKPIATPPVALGCGYSVEFRFNGGIIECEWAPGLPEPEIGRKLLPMYYRARNEFFKTLCDELGVNGVLVDLPGGAA